MAPDPIPQFRTTITRSRAGHYSATVRAADGRLVGRKSLLSSLLAARVAAKEIIAGQSVGDEQLLAALGPCGK